MGIRKEEGQGLGQGCYSRGGSARILSRVRRVQIQDTDLHIYIYINVITYTSLSCMCVGIIPENLYHGSSNCLKSWYRQNDVE